MAVFFKDFNLYYYTNLYYIRRTKNESFRPKFDVDDILELQFGCRMSSTKILKQNGTPEFLPTASRLKNS